MEFTIEDRFKINEILIKIEKIEEKLEYLITEIGQEVVYKLLPEELFQLKKDVAEKVALNLECTCHQYISYESTGGWHCPIHGQCF